MAQLPTSKSALQSGAAKDDAFGHDGDFTFSIFDLLANDPGGAAKVNLTTQFFFGDTAPVGGGLPTQEQQDAYLLAHGITHNADGTYTIGEGASDINYFVQIGNKGTWSQAHVDITAPEPVVTAHNGDLVAEWNFEAHMQAGGDNTGTPLGFWNLNKWAASHKGIGYGAEADLYGFTTDIQVHGVDGHRALDTAGSPGNIFLQAIPEGRGGPGFTMPDLVAGKEYHAEAWVLKQDYSNDPVAVANGTPGTDPDALVEFWFNDQKFTVKASDGQFAGHNNEFVHFDLGTFKGVDGEDGFIIQSQGTHDAWQGLLIDTIQIHNWDLV